MIDKEFLTQEKVQAVYHHQISIKKDVKGTSLRRAKNQNMNNKMAITTYLLTITLNVNGLSAPIKIYGG